MALRQIIYVSGALTPFSDHDLTLLQERSQSCNAAHGITGLLLFSSGFFTQIIEGEQAEVGALYQAIRHDPRHAIIRCLVDCPVAQRLCPHWAMAFCDLSTTGYSDFSHIERQLKQLKPGDSNGARRFMLDLIDTLPVT